MERHNIPNLKIFALRRSFIQNEKFRRTDAAKHLKIARETVNKYIREFKAIKLNYPEKLGDFKFYMPVEKPHRPTFLFKTLTQLMPELVLYQRGPRLNAKIAWNQYHIQHPGGYSYTPFKAIFFKWCKDHDISVVASKLIESFPEEDKTILNQWRHGNDHQKWQIAVILDAAYSRISLLKTMEKVECSFPTVLRWLRIYKSKGLKGYERTYMLNRKVIAIIKTKSDNLIHLMQQSPKLYGLQKVAWTTVDLSKVYQEVYGERLSQASVSVYLRKRGVRFRRAKEVLTSPDPLYREKFKVIQDILKTLGQNEKFFSIDEFGPFSVRPKGGKVLTLPGTRPIYAQVKQGKGWFIFTAALELSINQITHFYCLKKDTEEMIKLVNILIDQYQDQEKLYLSWDAVSFHASKKLLKYIEELNTEEYRTEHKTPAIIIAPLPASAQFLNVIESVFSGLAKAVLRNSDYESLEDCKDAIDEHLSSRNLYYQKNPKQAGFKIWGKEKIKPEFDKANICKMPNTGKLY